MPKADKKDLERVKDLAAERDSLMYQLGELEHQRRSLKETLANINKDIEDVMEEFRKWDKKQEQLSTELMKKYGEVQIDMESGEIIKDPTNSDE